MSKKQIETLEPESDVASPPDADDQTISDQDTDAATATGRTAELVRPARSLSISVRSLTVAVIITALVVVVAILAWLYVDVNRQLAAQAVQATNDARAEKIALDYAVNAATMDHKDLQGWKAKLVAGTSPELNKKLTEAGTSMEQVLVPLQWSSTAEPLVAKVRSNSAGIYVVDSFVSVMTKTVQSPEPLQSTATYSITIDSNANWQITDVGGIGAAMEPK